MSSEKTFTQRQVAEIINFPKAIPGSCAGECVPIVPIGRLLGKKGTVLFSRNDLYRLGIAAELVRRGLKTSFIKRLLPLLRDAWLRPEERGLVVYGSTVTNRLSVVHLEADVETGSITAVLAREGIVAWGWLSIKRLLDQIDRKARKTAGAGKRKSK